MSAVIIATGSYLPEKIITNSALEDSVDTTDEWIVTRTGIKQRHIAAENELTSHMAHQAATRALSAAGLDANDIDMIIVATTTPDRTFPSTATCVQHLLGNQSAAAFDMQAVCSGFVYALTTASSFIDSNHAKTILVIGAEKMSSIIDWHDRNTCILFGDGAGAVILQKQDNDQRGILSSSLHSDGTYQDILYTDGGVASSQSSGNIIMQGKEVFKHASEKMAASIEEVMAKSNLVTCDIDYVIPHQANARIIDMVAKKLQLSSEKVISTVALHANTSAASIPLAMDSKNRKEPFIPGQTIVLTALGGGLTWGSVLLKW